MRKSGFILAALFLMVLHVPPASGQDCSGFQKAVNATMTASNEVDAQTARFKSTNQTPQFDGALCNAAKRLKEQASIAAKAATSNCDPNNLSSALAEMALSADSEIKLFCTREVEAPRAVQSSSGDGSGFIFPDSDRRRLTAGELQGLSRNDLRVARNEIFARRGRYFKDEALKAHFSQFSWYQPSQWDVRLNSVEQANVNLIQSMER
jgi:hypothetical protein